MKNILRILLIFTLAIFYCDNAEAMVSVRAEKESPILKNFRKPLSEWPKIHPFSSQKEMNYYKNSTWFPELTLKQNQKKLVKDFVEKCCDFSFKIHPTKLKEIDIGRLDSGEYLIFASESTSIESSKSSTNMLIYNENYKLDRGLLAHCITPSFIGCHPIDSGEKYKDQLIECFLKLAEDPVGCKLFRLALTKHIVNNLQKIVFIPAVSCEDDDMWSITCSSGSYLCSRLAKAENVVAIKHLEQKPRHRFITFSPEFFTETIPVGAIKYENGNILFSIIESFREAVLFHEIIHSLHADVNKNLQESTNIRRRSNSYRFRYMLKEGGEPSFFRCDQINVNLFHNDEEYRTMYGINSEGLDLLNESSYLAHRYGFIRASHGDLECARLSIKKNNLNKSQSNAFFQNFFTNHGDHDLFEYYLSPNSPIKYPEFGLGQYKCADLDPKTGKMKKRPSLSCKRHAEKLF